VQRRPDETAVPEIGPARRVPRSVVVAVQVGDVVRDRRPVRAALRLLTRPG
jgi:hypothetical protein